MFADGSNKLYFHCVTPIVIEFEKANPFFQATDLDPESMENVHNLLYKSVQSKVLLQKVTIWSNIKQTLEHAVHMKYLRIWNRTPKMKPCKRWEK